jgi:anti-anti-sigma regulatory factor
VKLELDLAEEFGSGLADGALAAEFRMGRLDPYADICTEIVLDFSGVRHANSSFINALVAGFVEQHGPKGLDLLIFKGCNAVIRVLVESAISLGLEKHALHH